MKNAVFVLCFGIFALLIGAVAGKATLLANEFPLSREDQTSQGDIGEQWIASFGGVLNDFLYSVEQTSDGGFVAVGETASFGAGGTDAWILKFSADGSILWQKTYGGTEDDQARYIGRTDDDGFFVVGETYSFRSDGLSDIWILKLNADGSSVWQKVLGAGGSIVAQVTSNGELIVGGMSHRYTQHAFLMRIRTDGNILWQKTYEQWSIDSIQETSDGGYIESSGSGLIRLDSSGNILWTKDISHKVEVARQIADGGFIIGGFTTDFPFPSWMARLDSEGNILWQKSYQGIAPLSIEQMKDGNFIIPAGHDNLYKLDPNGNVIWQNRYRGLQLRDVSETDEGDIVAVGSTSYSGPEYYSRPGYPNLDEDNGVVFRLDGGGRIEPCSLIQNENPIVNNIELQLTTYPIDILTPTISISTTDITPLETGVNSYYWCQNGVQIPPAVNGIFTAAGLSDTIIVSLMDFSDNMLIRPRYTLDGGDSWFLTYPFPPYEPVLVGIAPRDDPQYPVRLFAGEALSSGLYRSGDWGKTWSYAVYAGPIFAASPLNPQLVYATDYIVECPWGYCSSHGYIYQSIDGGVAWTTYLEEGGEKYSQVTLSPVIANDGFYRVSIRLQGDYWRRLGSPTNLKFPVGRIALDPIDANRIYGVTDDFSSGQTSPDGGQTWMPWASAPPPACVQLMAHPTKTNTLYLRCATGLFRSTNSGDSWQQITTVQGDALAPHLGNPGQILWSHDGCLLASDDDGDSWETLHCYLSFSHRVFLPILHR